MNTIGNQSSIPRSPVSRSRRAVLQLGLAAAAAGLPSLASPPRRARAQANVVRMGSQKGATTLLVLKAQQELEKRLGEIGYSVTWTEFPAGVVLLEGLNAGAIDFGLTGAPPPIFAQAAGADLIYVLSSKPSPDTEAIIVLPDSPLQQAADLKGKKVAVAKGSSTNALLVHALEAGGLKWGDAEAVYLLPADAKAAFEGGSVDAWSIWDPYYAAEQAATKARPIVTNGSAGWLSRSYYLASRAFAAANQDALQIMEEAIDDSEEWQSTHSQEVADLLAGETGLEPEILLKAEERRAFGVEPVTAEILAEQQELADLFFAIGMVPEKLDVSSAMLQS
jgi:sulfonate transport system substrate-binding protein